MIDKDLVRYYRIVFKKDATKNQIEEQRRLIKGSGVEIIGESSGLTNGCINIKAVGMKQNEAINSIMFKYAKVIEISLMGAAENESCDGCICFACDFIPVCKARSCSKCSIIDSEKVIFKNCKNKIF